MIGERIVDCVSEIGSKSTMIFTIYEVKKETRSIRIHKIYEAAVESHRRFKTELHDHPLAFRSGPLDTAVLAAGIEHSQSGIVDPILPKPTSRDNRLRVHPDRQIDYLWPFDDLRFIGQGLHAKIGALRQHLALMIAGHPNIAHFAAWPVVFVNEIEFETRLSRLYEPGAYCLKPLLG